VITATIPTMHSSCEFTCQFSQCIENPQTFSLGKCAQARLTRFGLRFGEAAVPRVSDVDIKGRRIRVRRSVTYIRKAGLVDGPTKNHAARNVPLPQAVARGTRR
jgi:integrase